MSHTCGRPTIVEQQIKRDGAEHAMEQQFTEQQFGAKAMEQQIWSNTTSMEQKFKELLLRPVCVAPQLSLRGLGTFAGARESAKL